MTNNFGLHRDAPRKQPEPPTVHYVSRLKGAAGNHRQRASCTRRLRPPPGRPAGSHLGRSSPPRPPSPPGNITCTGGNDQCFSVRRRPQGLGEAILPWEAGVLPGFAAPSNWGSRRALGPWTDIYAIGATLLFLSRRGPDADAHRLRQEQDSLDAPRTAGPSRYSPQLLEVIDWCLRLRRRPAPERLPCRGAERGELLRHRRQAGSIPVPDSLAKRGGVGLRLAVHTARSSLGGPQVE